MGSQEIDRCNKSLKIVQLPEYAGDADARVSAMNAMRPQHGAEVSTLFRMGRFQATEFFMYQWQLGQVQQAQQRKNRAEHKELLKVGHTLIEDERTNHLAVIRARNYQIRQMKGKKSGKKAQKIRNSLSVNPMSSVAL